ncbi:MAG: type II secretion system F family protein [Clostridia bacterium]|nr:type II secretion system F family protein [Clostridia bacterium]
MEKRNLPNAEISDLCLGLSILYHSGVGLSDGLLLLAGEQKGESAQLMKELADRIDEGATLSDAISASGRFPVYVSGLLRVGEEAGRTEEALGALARYYEDRARLDRRIRSALLYPSLLLLIMLAVVVVLLVEVLPVFDDVYAGLGGHLTGVAGGLLQFGRLLKSAMPLLLLLLLLAVAGLTLFSASHSFRERVLGWWRGRFGDRGITRRLSTARFAQSLSMGMSSGLPVEEAMALGAQLLEDVPATQRRCQTCLALLDEGRPLAAAMAETELLPRAECRLLELGLRSGSGDTTMETITRRLTEESEAALEDKVAQVEPALVVVTSVLVGLILLSVMLPLLHIMTAIG